MRDAAGAVISELLTQSRFLLACELDLALQTQDCEAIYIVNQFARQQIDVIYTRVRKMVESRIKKSFSHLPIVPMTALVRYSEEGRSPSELMTKVQKQIAQFRQPA